ncbi:MAG: DEAD/DEAH box helicase [Candidatus Pacearchaeota archaeon]|nr:DEAD/DEAH box helicase [Candidatus Pacearchaeota archaeon]
MSTFKELGISEEVLKVIEEDKFEKPSDIQAKTIPLVLKGKDVIGGSATGSGKTLVFAAGIINNTERGEGVQALILTPTRELAEQVSKSIKHFAKYKPLNIAAVYGGLSINPQIYALKRADIIIGTPGRILDHLERGTLELRKLRVLVLDEADRMLDMGFIDDVVKIIKQCPEQRQTLLFSATIYDEVVFIAAKYMRSPVEVSVESHVDPKKLHQVFYDVRDNEKFSLLVNLLRNEKSDLVMVFCNTRHNTEFIVKNLRYNRIEAIAVHGGFSQDKRDKAMSEFHSKSTKVLVCTDVAARGLDIEGISHVYNYDIPKNSKDYIHRVGRTARAGKEGIAVNIVASRDYDNFNKVEEDESLKITKLDIPRMDRVFIKSRDELSARGEFRGHSTRSRFGDRGKFDNRNPRSSYRPGRYQDQEKKTEYDHSTDRRHDHQIRHKTDGFRRKIKNQVRGRTEDYHQRKTYNM